MKQLGYQVLKLWVKLGLYCYYKKINVTGIGQIPKDKPVLLLSNHQNALMDVLLVATHLERKPWFITRSDVFKSGLLKSLFEYLQMLPIYRIRDGKSHLHKNNAIFEKCGTLLNHKELILIFPEGNHSLKRTVRPLSKGFTRLISEAYQQNPELDLMLVPVGQNYANPQRVGDSALVNVGKPIAVGNYVDTKVFVMELKQKVFDHLCELTTHIPEANYDSVVSEIGANGNHFLNPERINSAIANKDLAAIKLNNTKNKRTLNRILFVFWNFPWILLWRTLIKPKVPEPEFEATFRFGFALLAYPLIYILCFPVLHASLGWTLSILTLLLHYLTNILMVKLSNINL